MTRFCDFPPLRALKTSICAQNKVYFNPFSHPEGTEIEGSRPTHRDIMERDSAVAQALDHPWIRTGPPGQWAHTVR